MEALTLLQRGFDGALGLGLLWVAWQALTSSDLFKAIVLFIAFGLLMALAWVRLDAPDIALAEAAIGAGVTGALLLAALARLHASNTGATTTAQPEDRRRSFMSPRWLLWPPLLLVTAGLGCAVLSLPAYAPGLNTQVAANLGLTGVSNPVTAVLLNFRGYDTLLEMVVLLLALLGVWSLAGPAPHPSTEAGTVLDVLSRFLMPLVILVAAYLLWVGTRAPGGAFQAGSLLGAAGVLLILAGWRANVGSTALSLRLVLIAGPGIFVAVAAFSLLISGQMLKYPPAYAGILILIIEIAATFSIGATLAGLFLGGRPPDHRKFP